MSAIQSKLIQVIENIRKELMSSELSENIGLHAGTSGVALFLAYYDRIIHQNNEINPKIIEILEHNIEQIDSGNLQYSICRGISGFGWLCEHLRKLEMLNGEDIQFLEDLDPFLGQNMIDNIQWGNYDFLHGALGIGTYFLSRFDKKEVPVYLGKLLTELEKSSIPCENDSVKWMSVLNHKTGEKGYNISLSHGISSIAAFLVRLHLLNFETKRVYILLYQTIRYILGQITYTESSNSYFPSYSKENTSGYNNSRLGWCYGDLGIAHTLWQTAIALKDKELENKALRILYYNTTRRDLQKNIIRDAGLCHGSSGIAHIFWNLFLRTGIQEFRETTDYWLNITMLMAENNDGLTGLKPWRKENDDRSEYPYSLLEGFSGIGLVLLSQLIGGKIAWDECLMLS